MDTLLEAPAVAAGFATLDEARDSLAALLGEDAGRIAIRRELEENALRLMEAGVVVDLHIGKWGARKKLEPADMGISAAGDLDTETAEAVRDILDLGQKYLLPQGVRQRIVAVEVCGRKRLEARSFSTPWGQFVPAKVYATWKDENAGLRSEYLEIVADIVKNLATYKTIMAEKYRRQAALVWRRQNGYRDRDEVTPPAEFVESYVERIVALIPTAEYIQSRFYWEAQPSFVPLPSLIAEDRVRAAGVIRAGEQARALDDAEYRAQEEARRDVQRYWAQRKEEQIDSFMRDIAAQFRGHIYDAVVAGLESLQANDGKLVGKAAQGLSNLVQWARSMNVYQDGEMAQAIETLADQMDRPARYRNTSSIVERLRALGVITRQTLYDLERAPERSAREVGIEDEPGIEAVRAARQTLGIEEGDELTIVRVARD